MLGRTQTGLHLNTIDEIYESIILNDCLSSKVMVQLLPLKQAIKKGGYYFCPCCDVHACLTDDISYSYQQSMKSVENMRSRVTERKFGRKKSLNKQNAHFLNNHL